MTIGNKNNEITQHENMINIVSSRNFWRIFEFLMHPRYPKCMSLYVHLQDQKQVCIDVDDNLNDFFNHVAPEINLKSFISSTQIIKLVVP